MCKYTQKPRAMQIHLHCHVSSGGTGGPWTHRDDGRNMQCKLLGLHYRGATVFLPQANIRKLARIRIEIGGIMQTVGN